MKSQWLLDDFWMTFLWLKLDLCSQKKQPKVKWLYLDFTWLHFNFALTFFFTEAYMCMGLFGESPNEGVVVKVTHAGCHAMVQVMNAPDSHWSWDDHFWRFLWSTCWWHCCCWSCLPPSVACRVTTCDHALVWVRPSHVMVTFWALTKAKYSGGRDLEQANHIVK